MHDPIAASRRSALRMVAVQAVVALPVALAFLAGDGLRAAAAAATGGLALALGNAVAATLSLRGAVPARFAFAALVAGTMAKWMVVFVALAIGLWVAIVRSRPLFPQGPTSEVAPTPGVA